MIGNPDNSTLENIDYVFRALANLNDFWNIFFPNEKGTNLYTDKNDPIISHSAWGDSETDRLLSFGPNKDNPFFYERWKSHGVESLSFGNETAETIKVMVNLLFGVPKRSAFWHFDQYNNRELFISDVNKIPLKGISLLSKVLPYQGLTLNCVNVAPIGDRVSGIPNIGLHPWLFHGYMQLYSMGMRPELFGYYLTSKYY